MPTPSKAARIFLAAIIGFVAGLFLPSTVLPVPAIVAPALVVATFVLACFALRCMSFAATLIVVILVAVVPVLASTLGLVAHSPASESLGLSLGALADNSRLLLAFVVAPPIAGLVLHVALSFIALRHSRS